MGYNVVCSLGLKKSGMFAGLWVLREFDEATVSGLVADHECTVRDLVLRMEK